MVTTSYAIAGAAKLPTDAATIAATNNFFSIAVSPVSLSQYFEYRDDGSMGSPFIAKAAGEFSARRLPVH